LNFDLNYYALTLNGLLIYCLRDLDRVFTGNFLENFFSLERFVKYGLDSNIAPAPFSVLLSILLFLGVDVIGAFTLKLVASLTKSKYAFAKEQAFLFGIVTLIAVLSPFAFVGWEFFEIAKVSAIITLIFGAFNLVTLFLKCRFINQCISIYFKKLLNSPVEIIQHVFLIGYFFLALGPITDADSLDYHIGVAINILNNGTFTYSPEWFHSRLAGTGEILLAMGLSIGAEQFGALMQFGGFLSIYKIFNCKNYNLNENISFQNRKLIDLLCLLALSSPVFLSLVYTAKPMLLPLSMTTLAVSMLVFSMNSNNVETSKTSHKFLCIASMLLLGCASSIKLNYLISSSLIAFSWFIYMALMRKSLFSILVSLSIFSIFLGPILLWKLQHYGGGVIDLLFNAFTGGWPGYDNFLILLRQYRDTNVIFPFSLLFSSGMGGVTTVLGMGVVIGLFLIPAVAKNKGTFF
jgi:hypothetical protein